MTLSRKRFFGGGGGRIIVQPAGLLLMTFEELFFVAELRNSSRMRLILRARSFPACEEKLFLLKKRRVHNYI